MEAKVIDGCISCGACIATCPEVSDLMKTAWQKLSQSDTGT